MAQKTVLITGTSTGIGAACVARQAEAGWKVYAGVRKTEDGERLADSVSGDVIPVIIDVTKREDIDRVLEQVRSEVGSLDGLVNNAGIVVIGPTELLTDEEWRWQFDVNFFSLVTLTREAMPLVDKANGRFVHIGSIAGRLAGAGTAPYAATKHAVSAFNWALRAELALDTKMKSSVIEPGEIKTEIWAKARKDFTGMEARVNEAGRADRYAGLLDAGRPVLAEDSTRGVEADKVAKAVEKALTSRWPRARYLVGPDAKGVGFISRLPDRWRETAISLNNKQMARAGRKLR